MSGGADTAADAAGSFFAAHRTAPVWLDEDEIRAHLEREERPAPPSSGGSGTVVHFLARSETGGNAWRAWR